MGPLQSGARFLQFLAPLLINLGETPKNLPTVASTTVVSVCFTQLLLRYSRKMVRSNAVEKMAASSMEQHEASPRRAWSNVHECVHFHRKTTKKTTTTSRWPQEPVLVSEMRSQTLSSAGGGLHFHFFFGAKKTLPNEGHCFHVLATNATKHNVTSRGIVFTSFMSVRSMSLSLCEKATSHVQHVSNNMHAWWIRFVFSVCFCTSQKNVCLNPQMGRPTNEQGQIFKTKRPTTTTQEKRKEKPL